MDIRVLLVDDSPAYRQAAGHFLGSLPGVQYVGSAGNGLEALAAIPDLKPDLVLMDIVMPQMNGFEATLQIKQLPAPPRVVLLSLHDNTAYRRHSEHVGADGFIAKPELTTMVETVIRRLFGHNALPRDDRA